MSIFYTTAVLILIVSWLVYHKIPWAHKGWKSEKVVESVKSYYSFCRVLHGIIIYILVALIAFSLVVGCVIKLGPSAIAHDAAEYIWNNNSWKSKTIESNTIPPELNSQKKENQPYAVIVDNTIMKAAPLGETLSTVAEAYSGWYAQLGGILFFFVLVIGIVLYPTEKIAEAIHKNGGSF